MKRIRGFITLSVIVVTIMGCTTSSKWFHAHPAYKKSPSENLFILGLEKSFVLNRSAWFSKRLNIPKDSIQEKLTTDCAQQLFENLKQFYKNLKILPRNSVTHLTEESIQLDKRIFIKGFFPEQGIELKDSSGYIPDNILIIHEAIIGTDLKRENFFDYALIHNESDEKKTANHLTLIISYTLWDNVRQRPLYSKIEQIDKPIEELKIEDIYFVIHQVAESIYENLTKGVLL